MTKTLSKFEKYKKAYIALEVIYNKPTMPDRSNIDATIQRFEFTFELCWKMLKDYLYDKGIEANNPRDVFKEAYQNGLLNNEEIWITMLKDRNNSSHTYDQILADLVFANIKTYVPEFKKLLDLMVFKL